MLSRFVSQTLRPNLKAVLKQKPSHPLSFRFSTQSKSDLLLEKKHKQTGFTIIDQIKHNEGLNRFIAKVYKTTGYGLGISLGGSALIYTLAPTEFLLVSSPAMVVGGIVSAIAGCIGFHFTKYEISENRTESKNSPARLASYGAIVGGMTAIHAPMWAFMHMVDPMIMPISVGLTVGTMGVATLWAHRQPPGKLLNWRQPLMGGLIGMFGVGLLGIGSQMIFGPNLFSSMIHHVDLYGGIVLFTAFTSYETHAAIKMYQEGDPDHLGCSINVYFDFMNLLVRFTEIVARYRLND